MKIFLLVVQMIPALITLVKELEAALPKAGVGAEKLSAVRQIVEAAFEGALEVWPVVEKVVGALVGLFNATGVFQKSE